MKRNVWIVCFLLTSLITPGCGPEALPSPTVTPTATVTPIPPTETPIPLLPTAGLEPEMFQEGQNGIVQEYQGGQYVDILVPNNVWGKTPEGVRVVIKDNWPVLEMDINNFQDPNGAKSVNIAKYDPDTKSWTLLPFSITREVLDERMLYERNNRLYVTDTSEPITFFSSSLSVLGIKVDSDGLNNEMNLDVMFAYRNQAKVVRATQMGGSSLKDGMPDGEVFDLNKPDVNIIYELVNAANHNNFSDSTNNNRISVGLTFMVLQRGATENICFPSWEATAQYSNWCLAELQKGEARNIPNKDNIDWSLLNDPATFPIDVTTDTSLLRSLWEQLQIVNLDGVFIHIQVDPQD